MAPVPSGVTAHSSQPFPSEVGRPHSSKAAVSKSGARAWVAYVRNVRPGWWSRAKSISSVEVSGPWMTSPG